uniref:Uncharacterized protein n=1 Tax=Nelumbo nucifera TaxID=4432 RepID=A0A822YCG8_NELNU|nr:TPA_asm: hypothetical protein HUJ06_030234 [Nelumbo nucifera]
MHHWIQFYIIKSLVAERLFIFKKNLLST